MKVDRRVVLSSAIVLGVAALIAGSTIAYFTDKDTKENQFTVGDVDITLYESQLHRMNSGRAGSFDSLESDRDYCTNTGTNIDGNTGAGPQGTYESAKYCTPGMDANNREGISAVENGHTAANRNWGYSDATIIADDATYKAAADSEGPAGYFTRVSQNIVPGQYVRKFAYVKNESQSSDAYVMISYMVPSSYADNIELSIPSTPYNEGYFTALNKNNDTFEAYTGAPKSYTGYLETIDNVEYRVYSAVTNVALKPGEMTFWSPINTVKIKDGADDEFDYGDAIDVNIEAQGIQAKTFVNAIEAINNL